MIGVKECSGIWVWEVGFWRVGFRHSGGRVVVFWLRIGVEVRFWWES